MAHHNEQTENVKNDDSDCRLKYVKTITQILLPLSLFSLLLISHSSASSSSSLLVQLYDYLFSHLMDLNFNPNFNFKLFTYTTERNCIFLLCNGILVFIIQSSGLITRITPLESGLRTHDRQAKKEKKEKARYEESEKKAATVEKVEILEEIILAAKVEEEEDDLKNLPVEKWDEEDDEELMKKCEDFIKKVKLEIQGV